MGREALTVVASSFSRGAEDGPDPTPTIEGEESAGAQPKSKPGIGVMTWNSPSCGAPVNIRFANRAGMNVHTPRRERKGATKGEGWAR